MENVCIWTYLKYQHAKAQVKRGVKWFFSSESGGAGIIAAVILIVLVVVLGIAFRESIQNLWTKLWTGVDTTKINQNITDGFPASGAGQGGSGSPP